MCSSRTLGGLDEDWKSRTSLNEGKNKIHRMVFIHSVDIYRIPVVFRHQDRDPTFKEQVVHRLFPCPPASLSTRIPASREAKSKEELAMMAKANFTASGSSGSTHAQVSE